MIIPNGEFQIEENDLLYIIGIPSSVYNYCTMLGKCTQHVKNVMIVGGGRIAYYLTNLLVSMGMKVKIIENDKARCQQLSDLLPNTLIIYGDGTDENLLKSENITDMDVFVSMTGSDEENIMSSLLAKQLGVQKVIPKVSRTNYVEVIKNMGIETVINPKSIITNHILQYVRGVKNAKGNKLEALYRIIDGNAEILEFIASDKTSFLYKCIKDLHVKKDIIFAAIVRKNNVIIPHGNDVVKMWDRIIIITKLKNIIDLNQIIQNGGLQGELQNNIKKLGDIISS